MKKDKFIPEFKDIPQPRQPMPALAQEERWGNFREVELGFTEEMAQAEARRCLSCRRCIGCGLCLAECDPKAIEYDQGPETLRLQVASVVLAPGAGETDPKVREELGYRRFVNVVTTAEIERILSPHGPYGGFLLRPYDGEVPRKIAFVLCVGCRDAEGAGGSNLCGTVCCQAALASLLAARDQISDLEARVFYRDIRPVDAKGEADYLRARQASGIVFLRSEVKEVSEEPDTRSLRVKYETDHGETEETFDLVVLSTGLEASPDAGNFARRAGIKLDKFNFGGANPLFPLESSKAGIFVAGSFAGPTAVGDALVQASAVAGKIAIQLKEGEGNGGGPSAPGKVQAVMVLGGGASGMQAALDVADQGIETFLVERENELGGQVRKLHRLLGGDDPQAFLQSLIRKVIEHPRIRLFLEAQVADLQGEGGSFQSTISQGGSQTTLRHGALIVATGGREAESEDFGDLPGTKDERVLNQGEYEVRLARGEVGGNTVAMIQCVGSRGQGRSYCSRVCCSAAIKNALQTLQVDPKANVYLLYQDLRPFGPDEAYLAEARENGVVLLPWSERPRLLADSEGLEVRVKVPTQVEELRLRPDRVVLSTAGLPQPDGEVIAGILGVERNEHGFFREGGGADRPLELSREGIYVCGWARHPADLAECLCQAGGAAAKAAHFLRQDGGGSFRF